MCIYRVPPNDRQHSTLARIFSDPPDTDITWSDVLGLLKIFRAVEVLRETNGRIRIKYLDAEQSYHMALMSRPRGTRHVGGCQRSQIREILQAMLGIDPEEE